MTTGTVMPRMSLVRSLNCDTNWPMFTPCWPSAGPTGGGGAAPPPRPRQRILALSPRALSWLPSPRLSGVGQAGSPPHVSETSYATTNGGGAPPGVLCRRGRRPHRLMRKLLLYALDLPVFHLHEYWPAENGQFHLDLVLRLDDLLDFAFH